jgi:hypothetical protein
LGPSAPTNNGHTSIGLTDGARTIDMLLRQPSTDSMGSPEEIVRRLSSLSSNGTTPPPALSPRSSTHGASRSHLRRTSSILASEQQLVSSSPQLRPRLPSRMSSSSLSMNSNGSGGSGSGSGGGVSGSNSSPGGVPSLLLRNLSIGSTGSNNDSPSFSSIPPPPSVQSPRGSQQPPTISGYGPAGRRASQTARRSIIGVGMGSPFGISVLTNGSLINAPSGSGLVSPVSLGASATNNNDAPSLLSAALAANGINGNTSHDRASSLSLSGRGSMVGRPSYGFSSILEPPPSPRTSLIARAGPLPDSPPGDSPLSVGHRASFSGARGAHGISLINSTSYLHSVNEQ